MIIQINVLCVIVLWLLASLVTVTLSCATVPADSDRVSLSRQGPNIQQILHWMLCLTSFFKRNPINSRRSSSILLEGIQTTIHSIGVLLEFYWYRLNRITWICLVCHLCIVWRTSLLNFGISVSSECFTYYSRNVKSLLLVLLKLTDLEWSLLAHIDDRNK